MKLVKKITKHPFIKKLATLLITRLIRFVYKTNRWTILNKEILRPYREEGKQAIFVFWHGRLMMMPNFVPKARPMSVVISIHGDGEVIADCMAYFKIRLVRGSSRKGGANALRQAKHVLMEEKGSLCITPDGPRGPRMQVNSRVVELAHMAGVPIVPVTFSCSYGKVLGSWDRFLFALPFGCAVLISGDPVFIPPECNHETLESYKIELENTLNRITLEADRFVGRKPVVPAEIPEKKNI